MKLSDLLTVLGININNVVCLHAKCFGVDFEKRCLVSLLLDLAKSSSIVDSEVEEIYTEGNALHIVLS